MHDHECDVAVIGGGLAGAAAAVAFVRQGCSVRLFERRDLARDPNRGDILHAPTVDVIRQQLGLLPLLEQRGAGRFRGLEFEDFAGKLLAGSQIRESWLLNHAEMELVFLEGAEDAGVVVEPDRIRELERDGGAGGGWLLNTGKQVTSARLVVGADGVESLTRKSLDIALEDLHEYENWIVVLHSPTPSWLKPDCGWTLLHPEGTVWMLPTTPVGHHRVVLSVRRDEARDWMAMSETQLGERLARRHPGLRELELNKRGGSHVYRIRRTHAASYSGPRAALTGDAVHTTHPAGGQGLNIAIQDSAKLAELVGPVLLDDAASEKAFVDALTEYEAIRRPINTATLQVAHMCSLIAGPGQGDYEEAVAFYGKAATDPSWVWDYMANFGGRAS
ncbi:NAD(P)/FAD-dependent oxidoreductase [Mycobacterium sp. CVI_P3]|uniref:NAD(P)/FAD-dependent oxidoreductase n=1 Tax=Mycobacterium pinniadriaticum TaxID=2994102 RepID=A0ABT3SGV5_9MYCO|nr:NAD(P)/FAD-dependent oxidoreductase [Mycobacterium pinniadriaticum]MCX2932417.1 NAD(P)/FAD-dependent oxidoreductase [Mycobacterium pinniadriaticum]MCX2938726.1 NAD(P)/FAD-dependent oxidoreductase [Mycobacterium pinniadriaticum]